MKYLPTKSIIMIALCAVFSAHAQEEPKEEKKPVIEKISETEYKLGEILFNKKSREISFSAAVNQDAVVLEFALANSQNGKLHESLLATPVRPFDLQVVLKLLKYEASERDLYPPYDEEGNISGPMKVDEKGRISVAVTYDEPVEGWAAMAAQQAKVEAAKEKGTKIEEVKFEMKSKTVDLGDMIMNAQTEVNLGDSAWIYTGSVVSDGQFMADVDGAMIAVYRAEDSMVNAFAEGSDNDEVWFPKKGAVPPIGTVVTVKIRPRKK
jgi:hypothetical protein